MIARGEPHRLSVRLKPRDMRARDNFRSQLRFLGVLCALLGAGLCAYFFFPPLAGPGAGLFFSGYATNSAGARVGIFNVASSNQHQILYRAMSDPEWPQGLGSGGPFSPERFVQYGRLPGLSRLRLEVPVPTVVPPGCHYHLSFAYCRDRGRLGEQAHRFWHRWVLRWMPMKQERFPPPGFGSRTIVGREVEL